MPGPVCVTAVTGLCSALPAPTPPPIGPLVVGAKIPWLQLSVARSIGPVELVRRVRNGEADWSGTLPTSETVSSVRSYVTERAFRLLIFSVVGVNVRTAVASASIGLSV